MELNGYFYEGVNKEFRTFVKGKVLDALTDILQDEDVTVGGNGVELVQTVGLASNRLREGKPFALLTMRPVKGERVQLLDQGTRDIYAGRKYPWSFLISVSQGNIGGRVPSEVRKASDNELMDAVWAGFESRYTEFRNMHFYELTVGLSDDPQEKSMVSNLLLLQFYNFLKMPHSELIEG